MSYKKETQNMINASMEVCVYLTVRERKLGLS